MLTEKSQKEEIQLGLNTWKKCSTSFWVQTFLRGFEQCISSFTWPASPVLKFKNVPWDSATIRAYPTVWKINKHTHRNLLSSGTSIKWNTLQLLETISEKYIYYKRKIQDQSRKFHKAVFWVILDMPALIWGTLHNPKQNPVNLILGEKRKKKKSVFMLQKFFLLPSTAPPPQSPESVRWGQTWAWELSNRICQGKDEMTKTWGLKCPGHQRGCVCKIGNILHAFDLICKTLFVNIKCGRDGGEADLQEAHRPKLRGE